MTATLTFPAKVTPGWREQWADLWLAELPLRVARESARAPAPGPAEPRSWDDATWIAQVRHGNETAARDLVERLYPTVMKIVRCRLPRRTLEEDLAQAVFTKVFRSLHQFSGRVPLEHWVTRIAINTCINQLKYEAVRPELRMSDLSQEQEAVVQQLAFTNDDLPPERGRAAHELLQQLLAPLRPDDRLIIRLLHLEERKVAEIAQMTGWSASSVKVKAFRARHKMRRLWKTLLKGGNW
jgi:RNA polymerase sigma-70 factor (ECF subfamily)